MNNINKIFESKRKYHISAANEPLEEKIKKLIELQKIDLSIKKSRNVKIKSYQYVWNIFK